MNKFSLLGYNHEKIITITKILIIVLIGSTMILYITPYFDVNNKDAFLYGVLAKRLATTGQLDFNNEFIKNENYQEFAPKSVTVHDTILYSPQPGFPVLASISYLIFGDFGLFYLSPVFTIGLLVLSDRIATRLFGALAGLITLSFLATSQIIFVVGQNLLTDNVFAVIFLLGIYFLIRFFNENNFRNIFYASIFFAICPILRLNGFAIFPIEVVAILVCLKGNLHSRQIKKLLLGFSIPWILSFTFFFAYNEYYFDDPLAKYYIRTEKHQYIIQRDLQETIEPNMYLKYPHYVLPYPVYKISSISLDTENQDDLRLENVPLLLDLSSHLSEFFTDNGRYILGVISIAILLGAIILTLVQKICRREITILVLFVTGMMVSYSMLPLTVGTARYMIPIIPIMSIILAFLISFGLKMGKFTMMNGWGRRDVKIRVLQIITVVSLAGFFSIAIYSSEPAQIAITDKKITDPFIESTLYNKNFEFTDNKTVIVSTISYKAYLHGGTHYSPFSHSEIKNYGTSPTDNLSEAENHIKMMIQDNYDVLAFKQVQNMNEKLFFDALDDSDQFLLREYSNIFCKIEYVVDEPVQYESCEQTLGKK